MTAAFWALVGTGDGTVVVPAARVCGSVTQDVGAENDVTAADLVFAVVRRFTKFGIWLREHSRLGHCQ